MRFTQTLLKTSKEHIKDEESRNAQLLIRAGYIDKLMAGVYTYLPMGHIILQRTSDLVRTHMQKINGIEILMPALHPKLNYELTKRWDTMDSVIRFTTHWTQSEYALGATHEEIVTPLLKKYIQSYKDLPKAVFQIQDKFRDEKRAKSGLLRGREFFMKDMYSFHTSEEDLDHYYEQVKGAYMDIFNEAGIGEKTYFTYASGGDFSKYSHEFQTLSDAGEDLIYICDKCRVAINKEIIDEQSECPECRNKDLREERAIEVGNIFKLMTKFSDSFGLNFTDKDGLQKPVIMGCYGIGIGRLMGIIAELHSDEKGLIWPECISPYKIHLIGLNLDNEAVRSAAEKLYDSLVSENIDILFDDRLDTTAGEKFADADLLGCPIHITISRRTLELGTVELKRRASGENLHYSTEHILEILKKS